MNQSQIRRWVVLTGLVPAMCAMVYTQAAVEPAAEELLEAVSATLGGARTLRVQARHELDPSLGVGGGIDRGAIEVTVQRPNRFHAVQPAGPATREIAYDGSFLCVMHPVMKHHALEALEALSIEAFADQVDARFGFRPPVAELLANDMSATMLRHVTLARIDGREAIEGKTCDRLRLDQEGMTSELWVAVDDRLPRRLRITFTDLPEQPAWDIQFSEWALDPTIDEDLFSKRPSDESLKVPMLKSR